MNIRSQYFQPHIKMKMGMVLLNLLIVFTTSLSGQCIQGNCMSGKGTYLFRDGSKYNGTFVKYFPHGYGNLNYKNGNVYTGSWVRGKKHGQGTMKYKNGGVYTGEFNNDVVSGNGKMRYNHGDVYEGLWLSNKPNGKGTYIFKNGDKYHGAFSAGSFQGFGILVHPDGSRYEGNWIKNVRNGEGKFVDAQGRVKSQKHNMNVLVWEENIETHIVETQSIPPQNNSKNEPINCNQKECDQVEGFYVYGDGSRYEGYFVNGEGNGYGKCYYANGDFYQGKWKNHSPNGVGTMTFDNGISTKGVWEEGALIKKDEKPSSIANNKPRKEEIITHKSSPQIHALIVGIATYNHTKSLKYTDDDAYRLYAFLKSPEGGALQDHQISLLIDEAATRTSILKEMDKMASRVGENDVIIVYLSGHGLDGHFVPYDFDGKNNLIKYPELFNMLDRSKAKHRLFITDACHSGSMLASAKSGYESSLAGLYEAYAHAGSGSAFITSSKGEEVSLEHGGMRQGIFSHFLIRGLKGEANTNHDHLITVEELYRYVSKEVKTYTAGAQNPLISGNYDPGMPVAMMRKKV